MTFAQIDPNHLPQDWTPAAVVGGIVIVLGLVGQWLQKWWTDKNTERIAALEHAERQCQEDRKDLEKKLLASMTREQVLREILPAEMRQGVLDLLKEQKLQTRELEKQTAVMTKWGSDPFDRLSKDNQDKIKQLSELIKMAHAAGNSMDAIKIVLEKHGYQLEDINNAIAQMSGGGTHIKPRKPHQPPT